MELAIITNRTPTRTAQLKDNPFWKNEFGDVSITARAVDTTNTPTKERSIPRLITTIAIAILSIPNTETLRTNVRRFSTSKNPFRKILKDPKIKTVITKTTASWLRK